MYKNYNLIIGERIKQYRINKGMSQSDLQDASGISIRSISRLEQGASVQLDSLIKILFALGIDENLELLIPDQAKRPTYYLYDKPKKRVQKHKLENKPFKWGDEE